MKAGKLFFVLTMGLTMAVAMVDLVHARALEFRDYTLDNGLRVILLQTNRAPLIFSQLWYRVGAVDEVTGKTGLAHMLEHMMFKGTQTLEPGEYSRIIAKNGGQDNASTSQDFTNYYAKLAADRLDLALRLEADRMRGLKLLEKEFRSENAVVREERRTRTDNSPAARFQEKFQATVFQHHPYGRPVIGAMKDIEGHTLADLQAWYDRYYAPNNAILVVVGDFQFEQATQLIDTYFAKLKANPDLQPAVIAPEPEQVEQRRITMAEKGVAVSRWNMAFHTPSLVDSCCKEDVFALDVLSSILADGGSSRLYRSLVVDKKLVLTVGAGLDGISRYPGILNFHVTAKPDKSLQEIEEEILTQIRHLQEELVGEEELTKVKNGLLADHIFAKDSVDHLAWSVGELATVGADWQEMTFHYPERIQAVTASQVQDVARRYLDANKATIATLTPSEK
ncbi:MAG: insulinase family protein [Magnetococcales bacterium]|nr:insulinase family protein [Magnetococcales bacterium]